MTIETLLCEFLRRPLTSSPNDWCQKEKGVSMTRGKMVQFYRIFQKVPHENEIILSQRVVRASALIRLFLWVHLLPTAPKARNAFNRIRIQGFCSPILSPV